MIFRELNQDEFDDFARNYPKSAFVQSAAMARVHKDLKRKAIIYGVLTDNTIICAGLFSIRPVISKLHIAHCNQGPLMDFENQQLLTFFLKNVKNELKKLNCIHCIFTPNFEVYKRDNDAKIIDQDKNNLHIIDNIEKAGAKHLGFDNGDINGVGRWFYTIDFSGLNNENELINSFDYSARKAIRKVIKDGIQVIELEENSLDDFKAMMEITAKRLNFKSRNSSYYDLLKKHFGGDCKVYIALLNTNDYNQKLENQKEELENQLHEQNMRLQKGEAGKKVVTQMKVLSQNLSKIEDRIQESNDLLKENELILLGGVLYIQYGDELTALFSGNDDAYFGFNGTHAIHWQAMKEAISNNLTQFNFYGTKGKFSGSEDEGNYKFKKSFGGAVVEQPGNFLLVISPLLNRLYFAYQRVRGNRN